MKDHSIREIRADNRTKGQISVMIAVMMTTFILLFAFVVNTGMLVHARINIQNAADLAAYAGAAVQARQMTQISYLNYEMRRQWKRFLFKVYVVGNAALPGFGSGGTGPMQYLVNSNGTQIDYQVPVTCIIFNAQDNYCQVFSLSAIQIPAQSYLDQITDTLRDQLQQIETIREANCTMIGLTNKILNYYWIFNADPTLSQLTAGSSSLGGDQAKALQIIQGLASEMGIVPRELILSYRINTLAGYLNTPTPGTLTLDSASQLYSNPDPASVERPIQAFYSAYYTLGNHIFNGSTMTVEEFLPFPVINIKQIMQQFDVYALDKILDSSNACVATIIPYSIGGNGNQGIPVGVYKDPSTMVSYAVRVKAEAQILFSPFGPIQMKAYAAAQPFGSRIGPVLPDNAFGSPASGAITKYFAQSSVGFSPTLIVPNLATAITDSSPPAKGTGWDTKEMTSAAYQFLNPGGGSSGVTISYSSVHSAYPYIMSANPVELTQYNIMNDLAGDDPFIKNFDNDATIAGGKAVFWAPIFPPNLPQQQIADQINTSVQTLIGASASSTTNLGSGGSALDQISTTLLSGLKTYITTTLKNGQGENNEGWNTVVISNPFPKGLQGGSGNAQLFTGLSPPPTTVQTSWYNSDDNSFTDAGRTGYSVKIIALGSLRDSGKNTTDGSTTWSNDYSWDDEANADLPYIQY